MSEWLYHRGIPIARISVKDPELKEYEKQLAAAFNLFSEQNFMVIEGILTGFLLGGVSPASELMSAADTVNKLHAQVLESIKKSLQNV